MGVSMTMDCADLDRQAAFWVEALRFHEVGRVPDMVRLEASEGAVGLRLLFLQQVPEPKTAKNRMQDPEGNEFCLEQVMDD